MMRLRTLTTLTLTTALALTAFAGSAQAANPYPGLTHLFDFAGAGPGPGGSGSGAGQLNAPGGIAVDYASGDVYVADSGNNRISEFDAAGNFIRAWGEDVVASGPDNTGAGFEICDVAANPSDVCKAGSVGFASGSLDHPTGVAVDNSGGPAAGSVYVQDTGNLRIQRFDADGHFVLMWGGAVNQSSGGDICPRPSFLADACKAGVDSSDPTGFNADSWKGGEVSSRIAVDGAGRIYVTSGRVAFSQGEGAHAIFDSHPRAVRFDSTGAFLDQVAMAPPPATLFEAPVEITAGTAGTVYVLGGSTQDVLPFASADFSPSGLVPALPSLSFDHSKASGPGAMAVDPTNQYLFLVDGGPASPCQLAPGSSVKVIEYHPGGQVVDCSPSTTPGLEPPVNIRGLAVSADHKIFMTGDNRVLVFATPVAAPPLVDSQSVDPFSHSARVSAPVTADLADTDVHVEFGTAGPCSLSPCDSSPDQAAGASRAPETQSIQLEGLAPDTTYHYRVVAHNSTGTAFGPDRSFHTFPAPLFDPSCPNNLARQQTGAAFLADCRAYELVSAEDQGGYNVESDLVAGETPYGGYPGAKDRVLYSVHDGGVPGVAGEPTNRGPDPYLASRDAANRRWDTSYVGIPASAPSSAPFSSMLLGADGGLGSFAFGSSSGICSPCSADGSIGIPIRRPGGGLIQGMVGSIPVALPVPAGTVRKPFSADGRHFVFGSKQQFEPAGNGNSADATIYDRDLGANTAQVVSTDETGATIQNGDGVAELDVSSDGSRIVIGKLVSTDSAGNPYYHLYMHVGGNPDSIDLTPGAGSGVLYAGTTAAGDRVYFSAKDALTTAADQDTDTSADIYRADVDAASMSATLTRVSIGEPGAGDTDACNPSANSARARWNTPIATANCDAVAIGGGGGVAAGDGSVYFLSPERLDTSNPQNLPVQDQPNLYFARPGSAPRFVATLESALNFGSFSRATGVAVDHPSGDVYVLDIGNAGKVVKKFDAAGNKVNFTAGSGAGTNQLGGADAPCVAFGFNTIQGTPTQLAVDQSSGNFYVPDILHGKVDVFSSAGDCLGQITVASPAGVAVNPTSHDVYVPTGSGASSTIKVFTPAGAPAVPVSSIAVGANSPTPKGAAVDSAGNVYVVNNSRTAVYDAGGAFVKVLDPNPSFGVAVDASDNVYVNEGSKIARFDSHGASLGEPAGVGTLTSSVGIAVDDGVYASNNAGTSIARFDSQLQPKAARDSSLVIHSVGAAATPDSADFQLTPSGDYAVFGSTLPLGGFDSADHEEVFRYGAAADQLDCVSCNPTLAQPTSDAGLPADGLGIADDGRVFFNSGEPLVLRDINGKQDAYEWSGSPELISSGTDSSDSGLLSISADATDAFFFTRETLAANDGNGHLMKLYDARAGGGFFAVPPLPACVASDECHGPGSSAAAPPAVGTNSGSGGNVVTCAKRQVKRGGRCASKRHRKSHHKRANAQRGGAK